MRYVIPTLFLILALLVALSWFSDAQQKSPVKEAKSFLLDIQSGNVSKVIRHFGTNVCYCPKKRGWGAYLAYQTDEEPNLAFLLGHPFMIKELSAKQVASPPQAKHGIPWEHPEDYIVDEKIDFDANKYSPFFLPLPMAYGKTMTRREFEDFIENPQLDAGKSFSLRLRPSLNNDAIKFDTSTIEPDVRGELKFLDWKKIPSGSWYMFPKNAGPVVLPDGNAVAIDKLSRLLPRLRTLVIELKIVRSAKLQSWTVANFEYTNATLEANGKPVNLLISQPQP